MTGLELRSIEPRDAAQVAALCRELGYDRSSDDISRWIADFEAKRAEQAVFVACVAEELVGWIEVSIARHVQSDPFALIGGLVVKAELRGRNVGKLLCQRAEAWCSEQGLDVVQVTSRSTREEAHRFYLRDGYQLLKTSLVFSKKLRG